GEDVRARNHHPHVDDLEVGALEHDRHDVLADVVDVALDRGDPHPALAAYIAAGGRDLLALGLDVGNQVGDRLLHHPGGLHDLGQEHLAGPEQVADYAHAVHQRTFDDLDRAPATGLDRLPRLLGVLDHEVGDAVDHGVREALAHRQPRPGRAAPVEDRSLRRRAALQPRGGLDQPLGRVGTPVEDDVLDELAQVGGDVVVHADHSRVDDAHREAGADRVVEKDGV